MTNLTTRHQLRVGAAAAAIVLSHIDGPPPEPALAELQTAFSIRDDELDRAIRTLHQRNMLVEPEESSSKWAERVGQSWGAAGWDHAADYLLATYDYPFVDYTELKEAFGIDAEVMKGYRAVEPDVDRAKIYPSAVCDWLPAVPTRVALSNLNESLQDMIADRQPARQLDRHAVETLMSAAFGRLRSRGTDSPERASSVRRTSPSGGSRHPTEGYVLTHGVDGLPDAVYHFGTLSYQLQEVARPIPVADLIGASDVGQLPVSPSALVLTTSVFERNMYRYREPRTFRTVSIDVGHIVATLELCATALGLATRRCHDCRHRQVEALLQLDPASEGSMCCVLVKERTSG